MMYAKGTHELRLDGVLASTEGIRINFTRGKMPLGDVATVVVMVSLNGGGTWYTIKKFGLIGGEVFKEDGTLDNESFGGFTWAREYDLNERGENKRDANGGLVVKRTEKGTNIRVIMEALQEFESDITIEELDINNIGRLKP